MDFTKTQQLYTVREKQVWCIPWVWICTWQRFMCAQLADGDNEGVQAFALALGVELSQNDGVVWCLPNCNRNSQTHLHTYRVLLLREPHHITRNPDWPHWMSPQSYSSMKKCCSSQWKLHSAIFLTIKHQAFGTPASEAEGTINNLMQTIKNDTKSTVWMVLSNSPEHTV